MAKEVARLKEEAEMLKQSDLRLNFLMLYMLFIMSNHFLFFLHVIM